MMPATVNVNRLATHQPNLEAGSVYIPFLQVCASGAIYRQNLRNMGQSRFQRNWKVSSIIEFFFGGKISLSQVELERYTLYVSADSQEEEVNESWLFLHMRYLLPEGFTLHVDYRSVIHFLLLKFRRTQLQLHKRLSR